jgi:hypothetical protein
VRLRAAARLSEVRVLQGVAEMASPSPASFAVTPLPARSMPSPPSEGSSYPRCQPLRRAGHLDAVAAVERYHRFTRQDPPDVVVGLEPTAPPPATRRRAAVEVDGPGLVGADPVAADGAVVAVVEDVTPARVAADQLSAPAALPPTKLFDASLGSAPSHRC